MRSPGMPHPALGGIALVGDPHVGFEILELVVLHVLLGVADQLEDQQVPRVREHEGALLAQRGVVPLVEPVGVAPDELVLQRARRQVVQPGGLGEGPQHVRLDPHRITVDVGRPDLEAGDVAVVVHVRLARGDRHVEVGQDELPLEFGVTLRVEQGDLQQVVALEHLVGDAELLGHEARGGDAAPLAVAAVLHLFGGLVDEPPLHRHRAGKAGDPAAAFLDGLGDIRAVRIDLRPPGQQLFGEVGGRNRPAAHRAAPTVAAAGSPEPGSALGRPLE